MLTEWHRLAYGTLFGLMPVLVLEYFGISNFSGNNGLLSLAPAVGGDYSIYQFLFRR